MSRRTRRKPTRLPAYIPADATWYVATLVVHITVGRNPTSVLHRNTVLVKAHAPEEAYRLAVVLGRKNNRRWRNSAGELVRIRFLGLEELNVVHDELEHGAELFYNERLLRPRQRPESWVRPKRVLAVFTPRTPSKGPDYMSAESSRMLELAVGPNFRDR
jgi:hypothetical protein